ncbi:ester cyclase [Streptomyces lonarensis]|uniref:Ester cyclase n=1 Tax=Streptomyces lonarensis TaxID=700599 RepID=A0A7X6HYY3_9ACTN|nr:ester cyclase [Streptomyces lonarensis]NJQ06076.1 ester cyclase [Streptomyces lonarensis]
MITAEIRAARQQLVLDHFEDEVRQEWDDVLSTFPHPHYELIPTMTVHDGGDQVRGYYHETRIAFPDQRHEIIALRHADDAVIVEFWLIGTHLGPLGEIPATGGTFRVRMTAYFLFDEAENLVCERVYFDTLSMLRQLIGGLNMRNPKNWLLTVRCLRGLLRMAGGEPHPSLVDTVEPELARRPAATAATVEATAAEAGVSDAASAVAATDATAPAPASATTDGTATAAESVTAAEPAPGTSEAAGPPAEADRDADVDADATGSPAPERPGTAR